MAPMRFPLLLLLLPLGGIAAEVEVAVITLHNRPVAEVLPMLRPHLEPDGGISGIGNQLVISAPAATLARVRGILAEIDRPPRQLVISVRQEGAEEAAAGGAGVSGRVGSDDVRVTLPPTPSPPGVEVRASSADDTLRARVWSSRDLRENRAMRQVRVLEGGSAHIAMGISYPLPLRQYHHTPAGVIASDSVVFRNLDTGFRVSPTLSGDTVTLDISPRQEELPPGGGGVARVRQLSTRVSGRLGEWIPLGGDYLAEQSRRSGYTSQSTRDLRRDGRILLKVEEVR